MYDNGYIVKCRSILTNDICLSEASHKADVFLVCISYLTYSLKKCINNLAVWKIRVNTHTHTHSDRHSPRVNLLIFKKIYKDGNSFFRSFPPFSVFVCPLLSTFKLNDV